MYETTIHFSDTNTFTVKKSIPENELVIECYIKDAIRFYTNVKKITWRKQNIDFFGGKANAE